MLIGRSSAYVYRAARIVMLCGLLLMVLFGSVGCTTSGSLSPFDGASETTSTLSNTGVRDVHLSAGDEIRISVYGHPALSHQFVVPPNGQYFYPLVGELQLEGRSVRELRAYIAETLGRKRSHRLSSGDDIAIRVYGHAELSVQSTVPQDGLVQLPLAGAVRVTGLTPTEASDAAAKKLQSFVKKPRVTVQVLRYQGATPISDPQVSINLVRLTQEKFFVLGEVRRPGVFALSGSVRLLDAVAMAGGSLPDAKTSKVFLIRPAPGKKEPETLKLDLDEALTKGTPSENPLLKRGDIVFVPETGLAKVSRILGHVDTVIRPFVTLESGIWLWQNIDVGPPDPERITNVDVTPVIDVRP